MSSHASGITWEFLPEPSFAGGYGEQAPDPTTVNPQDLWLSPPESLPVRRAPDTTLAAKQPEPTWDPALQMANPPASSPAWQGANLDGQLQLPNQTMADDESPEMTRDMLPTFADDFAGPSAPRGTGPAPAFASVDPQRAAEMQAEHTAAARVAPPPPAKTTKRRGPKAAAPGQLSQTQCLNLHKRGCKEETEECRPDCALKTTYPELWEKKRGKYVKIRGTENQVSELWAWKYRNDSLRREA